MTENNPTVSFKPSDGLSYAADEPKYWDEGSLNKEITRAFALCHSCRMCFKFCDAFPTLFRQIDEKNDDPRKLDAFEIDKVMQACFQCKLCEVECPYTPRSGHEFQLDFPKLVHRYHGIQAKKRRLTLREKLLTNIDRLGVLARLSFGLVNRINQFPPQRWLLEKVAGIHRKKLLPDFASQTFESKALRQGWIKAVSEDIEIVLFQTCYVENNEPDIGVDLLEVMNKNGINITCLADLKCCGMPNWESGDLTTLRENAHKNLDVLLPYVEAGAKVMAVNPTCTMMMKREYTQLLEGEDKKRAEILAAAIVEPAEYLWSIRKENRFCREFKSSPGQMIAYHISCHFRSLGVGFRAREIFKQIPDVNVKIVTECCGHNGTYAMKVETFEDSGRIGRKAFEAMKAINADIWATDCPLAAVQFKQFTGIKPLHPMSILARSYRENGFDDIKLPLKTRSQE